MGKFGGATPLRSLHSHFACPSTAPDAPPLPPPGQPRSPPLRGSASAAFAAAFEATDAPLPRSTSFPARRLRLAAAEEEADPGGSGLGGLVEELNALLRRPDPPQPRHRPVSPSFFPPSPRLHCQLGHAWRSGSRGSPERQPGPPPAFAAADPFAFPSASSHTPPPPALCLGMGQRLARQDVDEGVRLYHLQKHEVLGTLTTRRGRVSSVDRPWGQVGLQTLRQWDSSLPQRLQSHGPEADQPKTP